MFGEGSWERTGVIGIRAVMTLLGPGSNRQVGGSPGAPPGVPPSSGAAVIPAESGEQAEAGAASRGAREPSAPVLGRGLRAPIGGRWSSICLPSCPIICLRRLSSFLPRLRFLLLPPQSLLCFHSLFSFAFTLVLASFTCSIPG